MPRRDGTGPQGQGQMTGRGLGFCADDESSLPLRGSGGFRRLGLGRGRTGLGRGLGLGRGGRGYGNRFRAIGGLIATGLAPEADQVLGAEEEKTMLKSESRRLKSVLADIDKRLGQLGNDDK